MTKKKSKTNSLKNICSEIEENTNVSLLIFNLYKSYGNIFDYKWAIIWIPFIIYIIIIIYFIINITNVNLKDQTNSTNSDNCITKLCRFIYT